MTDKVTLNVDRSGYGGLQLSINVVNPDGGGYGYRLCGPKYAANSTTVLRHVLNERDIAQIERYLALAKQSIATPVV